MAYNGYPVAGTLDFNIVLDVDCASATFDTLNLLDMRHSVLGASDTQVLDTNLPDSISKITGNLDGYTHCGTRTFSITTTPSTYYSQILSLDTSTDTLTLGLSGTTTFTDVADYTIEVTVILTDYPTVSTTATFLASVTDCEVTGLSMTAVTNQAYDVYTPQI